MHRRSTQAMVPSVPAIIVLSTLIAGINFSGAFNAGYYFMHLNNYHFNGMQHVSAACPRPRKNVPNTLALWASSSSVDENPENPEQFVIGESSTKNNNNYFESNVEPKNYQSATKNDSTSNNANVSAKKITEVKSTKLKETVIYRNNAVNKSNKDINQNNSNPTSQSSTSASSSIQGLLPNHTFQQSCSRHITLTLLRKHFPTLLELPALTKSTAKYIYDKNVTVTTPSSNSGGSSIGGQEILAMGLEEVLGITRALAVAATAARRAGSLLDMAVGGGGASVDGSSSTGSAGQVECELIMDPNNPLEILVLWRTRLPAIGVLSAASPFGNPSGRDSQATSSSQSFTEFSGRSIVNLSPDGLVTNLQIQKVKINGVPIVESIGTALAAVRSAAKTAMASSSLFDNFLEEGTRRSNSGNPFLDGILNGIQREFSAVVDAVDALDSKDGGAEGSPLFVLPEACWAETTFPIKHRDDSVMQSITPILIDQYAKDTSDFPLVGSEAFVNYATIHQAMNNFANCGLPRLAGNTSTGEDQGSDGKESIRTLFASDVELITYGGDINNPDAVSLLRGAGKVADLYRSMALFREASGGDWAVTMLEGNWKDQTLKVSWKSDSPLKIEGTDAFVFHSPSSSSSKLRLPTVSDGDKEDIASSCHDFWNGIDNEIPLKIDRIENCQMNIAGAVPDSQWAKSFVSAALRSGWVENTPLPDPTIAELLRALTKKRAPSSKKSSSEKKKGATSSSMPYLDDAAAASFYGILRALYRDLPSIGNPDVSLLSPPAKEYLADTIELRGLLGEVLARGNKSYIRLVGVALSSLRAAIQSNRVRLAATPRPTIQITPRGSIKVDLILALWIDAPTFPSLGGSATGSGGFGVPLKIEVDSEYIIDDSGRISEHRINESRLNGILTPGDVFSKWIKGLGGESQDEDSGGRLKGAPSAFDSLVDAIGWVRSMQDRKK